MVTKYEMGNSAFVGTEHVASNTNWVKLQKANLWIHNLVSVIVLVYSKKKANAIKKTT